METKTKSAKDDAIKLIRLFLLLTILMFLLTACGPAATPVATVAPTVVSLPTGTSAALSVEEQMAQIDAILKQTLGASIAYNKPESMNLDQTTTIELLLNPSLSPQALSTQVIGTGQVASASIRITPRMKALLVANDETAFVIKPIHDSPEQLVSDTDTTRWAWLVTAKKGGTQRLTLIIYRLVEYDGKNYWREVQTYKADINIKVTMLQRIEALDWAWIIGIIISAIAIPAFWRWYDNKNKQKLQKEKAHKKSRNE